MTTKNNLQEKEEKPKVESKEVVMDISQFCEENQLSAYHAFAFKKTFSPEVKKTKSEWKKYLLEKKLISKENLK